MLRLTLQSFRRNSQLRQHALTKDSLFSFVTMQSTLAETTFVHRHVIGMTCIVRNAAETSCENLWTLRTWVWACSKSRGTTTGRTTVDVQFGWEFFNLSCAGENSGFQRTIELTYNWKHLMLFNCCSLMINHPSIQVMSIKIERDTKRTRKMSNFTTLLHMLYAMPYGPRCASKQCHVK
jgi:hypothetical protein